MTLPVLPEAESPPVERSGLFRRWVGWTVAGEIVGFSVPAVVGASTASRPAAIAVPLLLLAGAFEGLVLGAAQGHVLQSVLPRLDIRRFALLTSSAAVLAYLVGLLPSTLGDRSEGVPLWIVVPAGAVAGLVLLLTIGVAQWLELRRHVRHCTSWITSTAVAWLAGLAVFMGIATPLWREGQTVTTVAFIGAGAAVAMAVAVGLCTGWALLRIVAEQDGVEGEPTLS